jgi:hypothetical protein
MITTAMPLRTRVTKDMPITGIHALDSLKKERYIGECDE